jgi:hypothetical protein
MSTRRGARIAQWLISKRSLHMEPCRAGRGLRIEFFSRVNDAYKTASTADYIVQLEGCRREVSFSSRLFRRSKISWRTSPRSFPLTLILLSLVTSTFITISPPRTNSYRFSHIGTIPLVEQENSQGRRHGKTKQAAPERGKP